MQASEPLEASAPKPRGRKSPSLLSTLAWGLFGLVPLAAALATLCGSLLPSYWIGDVATHFRVQYFVVLAASVLIYCISRRWWLAALAGVLAAANLWLIAPLYFDRPDPSTAVGRVRLVSINVRYNNPHHQAVLDFVAETRPDIVLLIEVDRKWKNVMGALSQDLPYWRHTAGGFISGMAMFSRYPTEDMTIVAVGSYAVPAIVARFKLDGRPLTLVGAHPLSPQSAEHLKYRDEQTSALGNLVNGLDRPIVVVGDFNSSTWAPNLEGFLFDTNLQDSRQGRGVQATWPARWPPLRVPIDQCFVSPDLVVLDRWVGPNVGSDHLPIVIDFGWRK